MSPIHTTPANVSSQYHEQQALTRLPDEGSPSYTPLVPAYEPSKKFESGFEVASGGMHYHCGSRHYNEGRLPSPPGHMGSQATVALSISSDPNTPSKTVVYNETIDPADQVSFETDVDKLMKAIQQSDQQDEKTIGMARSPAQMLNAEPISGSQSLTRLGQRSTPGRTECKPTKKWACNGPNCNKRFSNKTQLDIHRRTHTGLRPYICTEESCGRTFSQKGNLQTHMRLHTGEKPYACSICGKTFAQRGNVRPHEETHKGHKPFICRLDDCNKMFTVRGNLKTHQNKAHKNTLRRLTILFSEVARKGGVPEEHQELFDYFRLHYKNSNKGIRGRGKARKVAPNLEVKTKAETLMLGTATSLQSSMPEWHDLSAHMPAVSMLTHPWMSGYDTTHQNAEYSDVQTATGSTLDVERRAHPALWVADGALQSTFLLAPTPTMWRPAPPWLSA